MLGFRKGLLALIAVLALAGCRVEVYDQLSQRDANEMTALLLMAGVDAERKAHKDGTFAVEVNKDDFAQAVTLIGRSGLPKPKFASMTDVLSDDRLIASPSEERARLNYALSQELSRTVSEIDGVVSARVHLATPIDGPLARTDSKSSASVAIHHRRDFSTAGVVSRIKVLVANAVDGLDYDNVSIALFSATEAPSDWSGQNAVPDYEFEDPTPTAPSKVTPAGAFDAGISPIVAAILGGSFIVLLLVGHALLTSMRSQKVRNEEEAPRRRIKR